MLRALANNVLFRVINWRASSDDPDGGTPIRDYTETESLDDANIVSSLLATAGLGRHSVVLDVDVPCELIRSTNGNGHLFIDVNCSWQDYQYLLDALQRCGVIEPGYVAASTARGFTAVRLPWVEKPPTS